MRIIFRKSLRVRKTNSAANTLLPNRNAGNPILRRVVPVMLLALHPLLSLAQPSLLPVNLRVEYKKNDFADNPKPRFSWELQSGGRNQFQSRYQIIMASSPALLTPEKADIWNAGEIASAETNQVVYGGQTLQSNRTYYWKVRSWNGKAEPGAWSEVARLHTALLHQSDWKAAWIGYDVNDLSVNKAYHLPPAPYLRKEYTVKAGIKKANLYVTSLGLFGFYINGNRIGEDYFTPGWTDYNKRVYYNAYDVTKELKAGRNALGAVLSTGWYAGYLGYALLVGSPVKHSFYGKVPLLRAQVEIEYTNGSKETLITDGTWKAATGAIREADILNGETVNANLEPKGWSEPGFNESTWKSVQSFPEKAGLLLQLYPGSPVRIIEELNPVSVWQQAEGKYLADLGQNFAGVIKLKVKGLRGDTLVIRYGEMLHPDGRLMTENLRRARGTDTYVLSGDPEGETYMPQFTYHGFQYIEISGLRNKPALSDIKGMVMSADMPAAGRFKTSDPLLNRLYENIIWTQRSNYFDIPTDCPQRDERLAWTGDAQVYMRSAAFNSDIAAFHTKWITDLNDSQWPNGTYPVYAPMPVGADGKAAIRASDTYSPGWAEAGIVCPYNIYKMYGDKRIVEQSWPHMQGYMSFLEKKSKGKYYFPEASFEEIVPKGGFGDWLSVGKKTPPDMLATIYYFYCADMMREMAIGLGDTAAERKYRRVAEKVKAAFAAHYIGENGQFKTDTTAYGNGGGYVDGSLGFSGHTQTAYNNAIYAGILEPQHLKLAGKYLRELVIQNNSQLSTGFLGFKPLLPALSATGSSDLAYTLIKDTTYPSLGFEVVNGATTIWERWNSYIKGKGFESNAGMNSFNHYAFGAVCEWMFQNMAGIVPLEPGFKTFMIKPEINSAKVGFTETSYHSIRGNISSSWKKNRTGFIQSVTVPVNTRARVYIPAAKDRISIEGENIVRALGASVKEAQASFTEVEIGSGSYEFVVQ